MAIKYLEWRSQRDGIEIRHTGNGREVKVGKYKLDGFIANNGARDKCIEVMGCYIHGCLNCYDPAAELIGGRTAQELNDETQERLVELRKTLDVEEVWAKALECGYTVDRFYRAWHYEEEADDLFKGYVRLFLKLKEEASGFPKGVETEEQKNVWREEYKEKYGIDIELAKVKKNPGLRYISKLMLNSLWGKFSMRNCLNKNAVIDRASEFYKIMCDHKIELCDIVEYSEEAIRLIYRDKEDFVMEHKSSNIVISLWTTSMARLKLLEFMREAESHGGEILYTDTDSIFVRHDRDVEPITTGKYLGEMSEEYGGYEIEEYCCGGAKQYALKMRNKQTGEIEYVMKIRGITFDVDNRKTLHYDTFREMVLNYGKGEVDPAFFVYKNDFGPTRDSKVVTREKHKMYRPVCQKGIIDEELNVMPFGFC